MEELDNPILREWLYAKLGLAKPSCADFSICTPTSTATRRSGGRKRIPPPRHDRENRHSRAVPDEVVDELKVDNALDIELYEWSYSLLFERAGLTRGGRGRGGATGGSREGGGGRGG